MSDSVYLLDIKKYSLQSLLNQSALKQQNNDLNLEDKMCIKELIV